MRKWEEIVKDKLEEPVEALPDSVLAEFRSRREAAGHQPGKRIPLAWALVPAAAAGLAAVLLINRPAETEHGIQVISQPESPVAAAHETAETREPVQEEPLMEQPAAQKSLRQSFGNKKPEILADNKPSVETASEDLLEDLTKPETNKADSLESQKQTYSTKPDGIASAYPSVEPTVGHRNVRIKVAPMAGAIAGGSLIAAVLGVSGPGVSNSAGDVSVGDVFGNQTAGALPYIGYESNDDKDLPTGKDSHYFPLKTGLSLGIPISERWRIATGVEYSMYRSDINYSLSGNKKQVAQYLGIPVRMDWMMTPGRRFEAYLGGGLLGDICLVATLDGQRIERDGASLSLIGAGGVQFNFSRRIGLYVEPEISWTIPSDSQVLSTWRSAHPVMFSTDAGIRITIGK